MGEQDSEGSGDCKDRVEINFHAREKQGDCDCGSDKCDCDSSCPNFKSEKSALDISRPYSGSTKTEMIVVIICVIIFWLAIYYFGLS